MKQIERIYCEGGPVDGQIQSVSVDTDWFNVTQGPFDYGNGPQEIISHYERTTRKYKGYTVFYSNPDWDR